jgi:hypothetical protein
MSSFLLPPDLGTRVGVASEYPVPRRLYVLETDFLGIVAWEGCLTRWLSGPNFLLNALSTVQDAGSEPWVYDDR